MTTHFSLNYAWAIKVLSLRAKVELGVMAIKGYYTSSESPELNPHHQMQSSVMPSTFFGVGITLHDRYCRCILQPIGLQEIWAVSSSSSLLTVSLLRTGISPSDAV